MESMRLFEIEHGNTKAKKIFRQLDLQHEDLKAKSDLLSSSPYCSRNYLKGIVVSVVTCRQLPFLLRIFERRIEPIHHFRFLRN